MSFKKWSHYLTVGCLFGTSLLGVVVQAEEGESASCGVVSVFQKPPETQDLYPVEINRIDERNVTSSKQIHTLEPGTYTLKLYDKITDRRLSARSSARGYSHTFELEVEANKRYHLAAKFLPEKRYTNRKAGYWQPVVWKVTEQVCKK